MKLDEIAKMGKGVAISEMSDQPYIARQYKDSSNWVRRMQALKRMGWDQRDGYRWIVDHLQQIPQSRILEIGAGPGYLWQEQLKNIPQDWQITLSDQSGGMLQEAKQNLQDSKEESAGDPVVIPAVAC